MNYKTLNYSYITPDKPDNFDNREEEICTKCDSSYTPYVTNCNCPRPKWDKDKFDKLINSMAVKLKERP